MFCKACGYQLREGAIFCSHCGTPVNYNYNAQQESDDSIDIWSSSERIVNTGRNYEPVSESNPVYIYNDEDSTRIFVPQERVHEQYESISEVKTKEKKPSSKAKKLILRISATLTALVILCCSAWFIADYIGSTTVSQAAGNEQYYSIETEEFTEKEAEQVLFAAENPEVINMTKGGFKCEGKRYELRGKITKIDKHDTYVTAKVECTFGEETFEVTAHFEGRYLEKATKLRANQEITFDGILDMQSDARGCIINLSYCAI